MSGEWLSGPGREADPEAVGRAGLSTTRRDVLAATALAVTTATAGCISLRGSARGIADIGLYNPTDRPRTVRVTVAGADRTQHETHTTVPPRSAIGLGNSVVMEQTVDVQVTDDESTTLYEWDVQGSLFVTLGPDVRFQTESSFGERRELSGGKRVDVTLGGEAGSTGSVRIVRQGTVVFETQRTFDTDRYVVYYDRLRATGAVTVTVRRGDAETSRELSLTDESELIVDTDGELSIELDDSTREE